MATRRLHRRALLIGALAATVGAAACSSSSGGASSTTTSQATAAEAMGPADLTATLMAIESDPRYAKSDWGYVVLDQESGEVLASQAPERLFDAGSTM